MDIISGISSIIDIFNKIKQHSLFKILMTIFIISSIILVKPITFYSKIYINLIDFLCVTIVTGIGCIGIRYFIIIKQKKDFDHNTIVTLIMSSLISILSLFFGSIRNENIFLEISNNFENIAVTEFVNTIHKYDYYNDFYQYVFSHFFYCLLFTFEFIQILLVIYLIFFFIRCLTQTEEPLLSGLNEIDLFKIFIIAIAIMLLSPFMYEIYASVWFAIF